MMAFNNRLLGFQRRGQLTFNFDDFFEKKKKFWFAMIGDGDARLIEIQSQSSI